jgi:hypothetical protein
MQWNCKEIITSFLGFDIKNENRFGTDAFRLTVIHHILSTNIKLQIKYIITCSNQTKFI